MEEENKEKKTSAFCEGVAFGPAVQKEKQNKIWKVANKIKDSLFQAEHGRKWSCLLNMIL